MQDIKLIRAGISDIERIAALAKTIWNQHYPGIISQAQIDYMLDMMYSKKSLAEQMNEKKHIFYLIEKGGSNIGFLSVHHLGKQAWFLSKFYIDQKFAFVGNGHKAFNTLLKLIESKKMTLTVNRQNYKSINFYFKLGFKIKSVADFDIGRGYVMDDFVMEWSFAG